MKFLLIALFLVSFTWAVHLQFRKTEELKHGTEYVWELDNKERVIVKLGSNAEPEENVLHLLVLEQEQVEGKTENWVNDHIVGHVAIRKNEIISGYTLDYRKDNGDFAEKVGSLNTRIKGDKLIIQTKIDQIEEGRVSLFDFPGDFFPDQKRVSLDDGTFESYSIEYTLNPLEDGQNCEEEEVRND